ncbi:MAG: hypothetical protein FJ318_08640, partial [SAR202 cluster bacterium]|nr:hypothetical protein [SAR202 cluster bacterium]
METANPFAGRSLLFVPAHRRRMVEKAASLPADAIVFELEDGVPADEKPAARAALAALLDAPAANPRQTVLARVNGTRQPELLRADLDAVVRPGLRGIMVPKVDGVEDLGAVEGRLLELESRRGLPPGGIGLLPIVESPIALLRAHEIATYSRRAIALVFGGEDFAREMGLPLVREAEALDLLYPRSALAVAAAAAGLP